MEQENNFSTQQNQKSQNFIITEKNKKAGTLFIVAPFLCLALVFLLYALVNVNYTGSPGSSITNIILGFLGLVSVFGIFIGFYLGYKKLTKKEPTDLELDSRSGEGENSIIPDEIKKWNWGAAGLTWIWGAYHGVWIAMIILVTAKIPFASILVAVFLGIKGNELAWKSQKYESVEKFLEAQNKWKKWGIAILILQLIFIVISYL